MYCLQGSITCLLRCPAAGQEAALSISPFTSYSMMSCLGRKLLTNWKLVSTDVLKKQKCRTFTL